MNGEDTVEKGESPDNIEKEGNHGWLCDARLNRSPGGTLLRTHELFEQYKEHSSI